nr:hypothetical protein [Tanacetum cinerariifolium]
MLISVQALRALAAWAVVCHHFMQIFFDFHPSGPVGRFFTEKGAVGVDIFFVISGLVIYLSTVDRDIPAGRFMLNRVIRIVPAYWLYTLVMGLLVVVAQPLLPHQVVDWQSFILSLLFIPSENPGGYGLYPTLNVGWTLNYEMLFYVLFSLVFLFQQRLRPLILGAALFAITDVLGRSGLVSRFYANDIVYEFLLGIFVGIVYRRGWIGERLWLPLLAIGAALFAIDNLQPAPRIINWGLPSAGLYPTKTLGLCQALLIGVNCVPRLRGIFMTAITITDAAHDYLADLLEKQNTPGIGIRVFITQPGTQYAETCIAYCKPGEEKPEDTAIGLKSFTAWIDAFSEAFLDDAVVDYATDRMGGQLT